MTPQPSALSGAAARLAVAPERGADGDGRQARARAEQLRNDARHHRRRVRRAVAELLAAAEPGDVDVDAERCHVGLGAPVGRRAEARERGARAVEVGRADRDDRVGVGRGGDVVPRVLPSLPAATTTARPGPRRCRRPWSRSSCCRSCRRTCSRPGRVERAVAQRDAHDVHALPLHPLQAGHEGVLLGVRLGRRELGRAGEDVAP